MTVTEWEGYPPDKPMGAPEITKRDWEHMLNEHQSGTDAWYDVWSWAAREGVIITDYSEMGDRSGPHRCVEMPPDATNGFTRTEYKLVPVTP